MHGAAPAILQLYASERPSSSHFSTAASLSPGPLPIELLARRG
jgi:hypothetical protein